MPVRRSTLIGILAVSFIGQNVFATASAPGAPVVGIAVNANTIRLDSAQSLGMYQSETTLDVHVVANCPHQVGVSFEGFAHRNGTRIRGDDVSVVVNGVQVGPSVVSVAASGQPTPTGGVQVPVDIGFALRNLQDYPAGRYQGVVAFQVMATPW